MILSRILALDISGNFDEGKGTTGVAILEGNDITLEEIKSSTFSSAEEYWSFVIRFIEKIEFSHLVVEGYRLYHHKGKQASVQANSILETPQLLGCIRLWGYQNQVKVNIQYAHEVKRRWSEDTLVHKGYLTKQGNRYYHNGQATNDHKRDALKHALHFQKYGKGI